MLPTFKSSEIKIFILILYPIEPKKKKKAQLHLRRPVWRVVPEWKIRNVSIFFLFYCNICRLSMQAETPRYPVCFQSGCWRHLPEDQIANYLGIIYKICYYLYCHSVILHFFLFPRQGASYTGPRSLEPSFCKFLPSPGSTNGIHLLLKWRFLILNDTH